MSVVPTQPKTVTLNKDPIPTVEKMLKQFTFSNSVTVFIIFALLPLFVMPRSSFAQAFDTYIKAAKTFYEEGRYEESGNNYDDAFNEGDGTAKNYYDAACSWALAGEAEKAVAYLRKAAEKGFHNKSWLLRDPDLKSLHDVEGWEDIGGLMQANLDEYERDFDKPLKEQLETIYIRDQTLRQLYGEAVAKFGRDSDEMNYFMEVMAEQDRINKKEVVDILDTHGWVGMSKVGGKANMALWLVVQHAPLDVQETYLPLLQESVAERESSGRHLAMLEDRILMRRGSPQVYGSQIVTDEETGKQVMFEIKDPEYVNQRRKAIGLGPIEEYAKQMGVEWTIEQKERP